MSRKVSDNDTSGIRIEIRPTPANNRPALTPQPEPAMLAALPLADAPIARPHATRQIRVQSADDLRRALRFAGDAPLALDASGLDRVLCFEPARGLIEVQPALHWRSLALYLGARDAAFCGLADDGSFGECVGDAVAVNAAGPDGRPIVAHLESLTLVTPDGELRRASRNLDPELFALAVGGHALFGVLYSVTLRLESLKASTTDAERSARLELGPAASGRQIEAQLLLPPSELDTLLAQVRARAGEWRLAVMRVEARRTLAEDETMLRWARQEYAALRVTFAVPPTLGGCVRASQVQRALIDLAIAHGGGFPIASTRDATRAQLEVCYPRLREFFSQKRRYDPLERLQNAWYRHHRALLRNDSPVARWSA
jgi:hypothetical protein